MKRVFIHILAIMIVSSMLTSCSNDSDEPTGQPIQVKPESERTIMIMDESGHLFNQNGELVSTLPNCEHSNQIIPFAENYYVTGEYLENEKYGGLGYWKNGEWVTVKEYSQPYPITYSFLICKRYDDIYLLTSQWEDYNKSALYIYKNGNPIRQDDPARKVQCKDMTASNNKCYLVGYEYDDYNGLDYYYPVLWTDGKKEYLQVNTEYEGAMAGATADCIYASGSSHTIIGGCIIKNDVGKPAIWIDKKLTELSTSSSSAWGEVIDVIETSGHVYALGYEDNKATLWVDGNRESYHHNSNPDDYPDIYSYGLQLQLYGSDLYALVQSGYYYQIWMNGQLKYTFWSSRSIVGFVVI